MESVIGWIVGTTKSFIKLAGVLIIAWGITHGYLWWKHRKDKPAPPKHPE